MIGTVHYFQDIPLELRSRPNGAGSCSKYKIFFRITFFMWWVALPPFAQADFDKGVIAFQTGENKAAFTEFQSSATKGDPRAMTLLGTMYHQGLGLRQDYKEAALWYKRGGDLGEPRSQHNLGVLYMGGLGVNQDSSKAIYWYKKAASQGYADSQHNLGVAYGRGDGVPRNQDRAIQWFMLAAKNGNAKAAFNLGLLTEHAAVTPELRIQAYKWAAVASFHANRETKIFGDAGPNFEKTSAESQRVSQIADTLKTELGKKLSRSQIDDATRLAQEYLKETEKDGFFFVPSRELCGCL